jgi:hypothetical protein
MMTDNASQKRAYFRLDVNIPMAYRLLSEEDAAIPLPSIIDTAYIEQHFRTKLTDVDQKIEHLIALIGGQHKVLGEMFSAINEKMNLLAPALSEKAIRGIVSHIPANLSAGGVSFVISEPIKHGQMVDLLLALDNNAEPVIIRSQIVKIIPQENQPSMAALEFVHVDEEARRQLVYFIQTQELAAARLRRGD